jgi:hypothetical protein
LQHHSYGSNAVRLCPPERKRGENTPAAKAIAELKKLMVERKF